MTCITIHGARVKRRNWRVLAVLQLAPLVLMVLGFTMAFSGPTRVAVPCPTATSPYGAAGTVAQTCSQSAHSNSLALMLLGLGYVFMLCMAVYWLRWYRVILTELRDFGSGAGTAGPFADLNPKKEQGELFAGYLIGGLLSRVFPLLNYVIVAIALRGFLPRLKRAQALAGVPPQRQATWMFYLFLLFGFWGVYAQAHLDRIWQVYSDAGPDQGGDNELIAGGVVAAAPAVPAALGGASLAGAPASMGAPPISIETMPAAQRLQHLGARAQSGALTDDESWHYASAVGEVHGSAAAAPWYAHLLHRRPDHVAGHFAYGCALLEQDDSGGQAHLQHVAESGDVHYAQPARDWLAWHAARMAS